MKPIDVLVVGAGPAGLATAIRVRERLSAEGREASVVVIDKAFAPGYHNLSGAAFEAACLEELLPNWQADRSILTDNVFPVQRDEMYFLLGGAAIRIPHFVVPKRMHHKGDVTISLSRLVQFMAQQAGKRGVEVYHGYSARSLIVEDGVVKGVKLSDVGLDKAGEKKSNYRPGEEIRAKVTILADGTHGVISRQFTEQFGAGQNPQVYSIGVKAVVQFPGENPFGGGRVVHTLGSPAPSSVFGGGFMYSLGEKTVAVGFILGLDWKYGDLNPQREFERFRAHPFIDKLLKGSVTLATGAKTIPEGGFLSLGTLTAPGAIVVGDGAGFVNMEKIKGIHYAIGSGICAAETVVDALAADDFGAAALAPYRDRLEKRGILRELKHARNYRQVFEHGLYIGTPLSLIQSYLPMKLRIHKDGAGTRPRKRLGRKDPGRMDQATFVSLTGSLHREDEPSHVTILDPAKCVECEARFANSCTHFCPGQVYRWSGDSASVVLSPSNCLHCMTCTVKCPYENIQWVAPEGGEGPRFKQM
ncbi:MAG TPA: electron-transfer flavoprotein:ubiquinone oxidoreductase [Candidatus Limnocylindrales bacterium]